MPYGAGLAGGRGDPAPSGDGVGGF
jgi:hypothetical protein